MSDVLLSGGGREPDQVAVTFPPLLSLASEGPIACLVAGPIDEPRWEAALDGRAQIGSPFAVDVHAAQWGILGRLVHAIQAGLVPRGVAIDEGTTVHVRDGELAAVTGLGAAWLVSGAGVRRITAADGPPSWP